MSKFKIGDVLYFINNKGKVAHRRCKLTAYDNYNYLWLAHALNSSSSFWIESRNLFPTRSDAQAECDKRNGVAIPPATKPVVSPESESGLQKAPTDVSNLTDYEPAIGEVVLWKGKEYVVIENESDECDDCVLSTRNYGCPMRCDNIHCSGEYRKDGKSICLAALPILSDAVVSAEMEQTTLPKWKPTGEKQDEPKSLIMDYAAKLNDNVITAIDELKDAYAKLGMRFHGKCGDLREEEEAVDMAIMRESITIAVRDEFEDFFSEVLNDSPNN